MAREEMLSSPSEISITIHENSLGLLEMTRVGKCVMKLMNWRHMCNQRKVREESELTLKLLAFV